MSEAHAPTDLSDLKAAVAEIVQESFETRRQVALLSYVGQALSRRGFNLKAALGEEGLADFIRNNLSDVVEISSAPDNPKILGAHPKGVNLSQELDPFGKQKRYREKEKRTIPSDRALIEKNIWFAFSHVLAEGYNRALRLGPKSDYIDYKEGNEVPDGIPVPSEFIIPSGTMPPAERNEKIYSNIVEWSEQQSIEFSKLISAVKEKRDRKTALDILLSNIRKEDLDRINIPLDIIYHLYSKKI